MKKKSWELYAKAVASLEKATAAVAKTGIKVGVDIDEIDDDIKKATLEGVLNIVKV